MHTCNEHVDRRTYIQTSLPNQPIMVTPADHLVMGSFMRPPKGGFRLYTIIPGAHGQARMAARYNYLLLQYPIITFPNAKN
jgi:hypothetical protein